MNNLTIERLVFIAFIFIGISAFPFANNYAQQQDLKILNDQAISLPFPDVGWDFKGVVKVHITVDETGRVTSAKATPDSYFLFVIQAEIAAKKATFPKKRMEGLLVYTFPPAAPSKSPTAVPSPSPDPVKGGSITDEYFTNIKSISDLNDVKESDAFYKDLKVLIEKEIAFGYADRKFHGEMPVTRGDLAYGLGKSVEAMARYSAISGLKFDHFCSQYNAVFFKNVSIDQITDLKTTQPYYSEVKKMAEGYNIYFYDDLSPDKRSFSASKVVTHRQFSTTIGQMFPSHGLVFLGLRANLSNDTQPLTRGEFATQLSRLIEYMYGVINNESTDDYE